MSTVSNFVYINTPYCLKMDSVVPMHELAHIRTYKGSRLRADRPKAMLPELASLLLLLKHLLRPVSPIPPTTFFSWSKSFRASSPTINVCFFQFFFLLVSCCRSRTANTLGLDKCTSPSSPSSSAGAPLFSPSCSVPSVSMLLLLPLNRHAGSPVLRIWAAAMEPGII